MLTPTKPSTHGNEIDKISQPNSLENDSFVEAYTVTIAASKLNKFYLLNWHFSRYHNQQWTTGCTGCYWCPQKRRGRWSSQIHP